MQKGGGHNWRSTKKGLPRQVALNPDKGLAVTRLDALPAELTLDGPGWF